MFRRIAAVVIPAVVAVPLLGGTASASCTDDLLATQLTEGYVPPQYSEHWWGLHYVHVNGVTVLVEGDALVSDATTHVVGDWGQWTQVVAGNTADGGVEWVDCVAG